MVVGSEGTLVAITEARVNLVPLPVHTGLNVCHFTDLIESMEAAGVVSEMGSNGSREVIAPPPPRD